MKIAVCQNGILLREIEYSDTEQIVRWRNQDAVRLRFIDQRLFTSASHEAWLKNYVETGRVKQFIICVLKDGMPDREENYEPVGSVYFRDIDETHRKAEYGIFIGEESARGKGVGSRTARLMLRYGFETLHFHRIFLRVYADNLPAIRSYEHAGFEREALLKDDVFTGGKFHDIILMAAINPKERDMFGSEKGTGLES